MSLAPSHVQLLERWAALGAVPADRSTRDFACDLLLKVWADRQAWVQIAEELVQAAERDRSGQTASSRPVALGALVHGEHPAKPGVERRSAARGTAASQLPPAAAAAAAQGTPIPVHHEAPTTAWARAAGASSTQGA